MAINKHIYIVDKANETGAFAGLQDFGSYLWLDEATRLGIQREDAIVSIRNIAERMGLRRRTIETHVAAVKKRGMILSVGGTRGYLRVVKGEL